MEGLKLSTRTKLYLILFTISFVGIIFFSSLSYLRSRFFQYKKGVESEIARASLFYVKSELYDFGKTIFDLLKNEDISISKLEDISRIICEKCSFLVWMDIDGNIIAEFGTLPDEDLYLDPLVQSVFYGENNTFMSDIYSLDEALQIRTAMIVESDQSDELIVLVGKTLPADYFFRIGQFFGRKVFFVSKDGRVFGEGFPVSDDLLKRVKASQRVETEVTKDGRMISVMPFLDFEQWGMKGFLVNSIDIKQAQSKLLELQFINAILFIISSLILIFGILRAMNKRLKAIFVLFLFSVPLFLSIISVFLFQMTKVLGAEYEEHMKMTAKTLERFGQTWLKMEELEEIKRILGVQVLLMENRNVIFATLRKNILDTLAKWSPIASFNTVEMGELDVNRVRHTYLVLQKDNQRLYLLKEKTPLVNDLTGIRFMGLILSIVSILFVVILGFAIKNADRPRFLRATLIGYIFLAPALIHLLWWAAGPVVFSFYLAFHRWNVIDPAKPFVGFDNFKELFQDKLFWNAMKNTVLFSLQVPIGMFFSLLVAIAVNRQTKRMALLRTIYYLPAVTAGVSTTIVWRWILNRDFGILNYVLGFLGIPKIPWLTSPNTALIAIMLMSIWQSLGSQMIIFLAGLQSIPQTFYEAASIDGANSFHKFRFVTIPLLKPTTVFVLVTSVIGSFQVFTPIYVLTQGGPLRSTDVVFYHIWESAWVELRMGYAAAQSWMLFLVLVVLTYIQFKLSGKESWKQYF